VTVTVNVLPAACEIGNTAQAPLTEISRQARGLAANGDRLPPPCESQSTAYNPRFPLNAEPNVSCNRTCLES
jgi:hypothetical protein